MPQLAAPIIAQATESCQQRCLRYALVMHDFSGLHYTRHESKDDRIVLYGKDDYGYFLQSALLVSDVDGSPVAPLYMGVEAADGVHSTRREEKLPRRRQLSELSRTINFVEGLGLERACIHIVDRQADSVLHLRRWVRLSRRFVIRSDEVRRVQYNGTSCLLKEVEEQLRRQMKQVGEVQYRGRRAIQYVGEGRVKLTRCAKSRGRGKQHREERTYITGRAIELRLCVSEVRDPEGTVLAVWRLWTNVEAEVTSAQVARWYYWRWRIESFFKLLKRGGQHLEQWQQESAAAIAKRLVVVAQVCVIVWELMQDKTEKAGPLRDFLVRLSGRLMKRGKSYTALALLAGMWQVLAIIDALERHTTAELQEMAESFLQILGLETEFKDVKELV